MLLRNFISYFIYGIKNKKLNIFSLIINLLILGIAIVGIYPQLVDVFENGTTSGIWVTIVAVLAILFDLFWQIFSYINEFREYFSKEYNEESTVTDVDFRDFITDPDEIIETVNGKTFCYSETICKTLRTSDYFKFTIYKDASKKTDNYIRNNFSYLFPFLCKHYQDSNNNSKLFSNDKKLCLTGNIAQRDENVHLCKGSYYNTYLTNKIFLQKLISNDSVDIYPVYGYSNRLLKLPFEYFSNEIGVSTLAITLDGYLFLQEQGTHTDSSAGFIVPSGSGSADWQDYIKNRKRNLTLEGIISYSTIRELTEETGYKKYNPRQIVGKNKILGFFRWLDYGGKPEFVSLSKINKNRDDIHPQSSEQKPLNNEYCFKVIDNNGSIDYQELNRCLTIMSKANCSLPLYVNLLMLKSYITDHQDEFEQFCRQ